MKSTTGTPFKIVTLGMEQKAIDTLEMVLRGPGGDWCRLSAADSADAAILEGDRVGALTLFDQHRRQYPLRPIIVLSVREIRLKQAISLKKPFKIDELMTALRQARQALDQPVPEQPVSPAVAPPVAAPAVPEQPQPKSSVPVTPAPAPPPKAAAAAPTASPDAAPVPSVRSRTKAASEPHRTHDAAQALETELPRDLCGYAPDVDLNDTTALKTVFYDPAQHLQGSLHSALRATREQNAAASVTTIYRAIILVPSRRCCHIPMTERQLRALSVMPLSRPPQWQTLSPLEQREALKQVSEANPLSGLENMLWRVALWTARGRLPLGIDLDAPVRLKHWPNLTRLPLTPQALRIAALWDRTPTSLRNTPTLLAVPQRYVFAFYSACAALDLVEHSAPAAQPPSSDPVPQRGLFKRILNVLRRAA